ncbi:hypothetical protein B5F76_05655 [Desulfovibrio sp. An276]|uniref:hypothetical protein n=1 Tax=Desulfovibrio sp. An276 TaxID=1965618 RepID=UPI000B3A2BF8|nr:hypothetical protein [Desulfovibrio sp. An276]OUO53261.1 hypothetical protein B5F76_05655 [Desulfovibrio sp. An276]
MSLVQTIGEKARKYKYPLIATAGIGAIAGTTGFVRRYNRRKREEAYIAELLRRNAAKPMEKNAFGLIGGIKGLITSPTMRNIASKGLGYAGAGLRRAGVLAGRAGRYLKSLSGRIANPAGNTTAVRALPAARKPLGITADAGPIYNTTVRYA